MKKALVFVLALILLVGVFAACGNKETPTTAAPAVTTTAPAGAGTTAPSTTAPNGGGEEVTTTQPVVTDPVQPDLSVTVDDKDPTPGEDYTGDGVQLPWMPF